MSRQKAALAIKYFQDLAKKTTPLRFPFRPVFTDWEKLRINLVKWSSEGHTASVEAIWKNKHAHAKKSHL